MKRFIIIIMLCLIGAMTVANPEPRGLISRIKQRIETRKKYKALWEMREFCRDSIMRIASKYLPDSINFHAFEPCRKDIEHWDRSYSWFAYSNWGQRDKNSKADMICYFHAADGTIEITGVEKYDPELGYLVYTEKQ